MKGYRSAPLGRKARLASVSSKLGNSTSPAAATSAAQRLRRLFVRCRLSQQFGQTYAKDCGQTVHQVERRIFGLALDTTQIGSVDLSVCRQPVLGQALIHSNPSQIPSQKRPSLHGSKDAACRNSNQWL